MPYLYQSYIRPIRELHHTYPRHIRPICLYQTYIKHISGLYQAYTQAISDSYSIYMRSISNVYQSCNVLISVLYQTDIISLSDPYQSYIRPIPDIYQTYCCGLARSAHFASVWDTVSEWSGIYSWVCTNWQNTIVYCN